MCGDNGTLEEKKNGHKVSILSRCIDNYTLYRFDNEEKEFMPFFNNQHSGGLKGLRRFCDYILLAEKKSKLFVFLIELKSGRVDGAGDQLDAAEVFMDYIRRTAERIKLTNGFTSFDSSNIRTAKVLVCGINGAKPKTKKSRDESVEKVEGRINLKLNCFPISRLCEVAAEID
jgi:hypothetical protein